MKPQKTITKQLLLLAFPIIFSNVISASSSLVSMYFMAKLNPASLAAGALITSTYGLVILFAVSMLYSVSVLVGQNYGAGNHKAIGRVVYSGLLIAAIAGLLLIGVLLNIQPILEFLHQPPEVSQLAGDYFRGITYGLIPSLMGAVYTQFFMGISKSKIMLNITILGLILNTVLSYAFIFGFSDYPGMGIYGAGLATSVTAFVLLAVIIIYLQFSNQYKAFALFQTSSMQLHYFKLLLKIGLPISIQYSLELLAFSAITYLIGTLGATALAAQQISLQCSMLPLMVVMGISQSATILISQYSAMSQPDTLVKIAHTSIRLVAITMLLISGIYWLFPTWLISFYLNINDGSLAATIALAKSLLFLAAFTQLFDAIRNVAAGILRGYGDSQSSMWTGLISCWVIGLPISLILGFTEQLGAWGLRAGMFCGIAVGCLLLLRRIQQHHQKPFTPLTVQGSQHA
ncbi:MATE family efflux transporter [Legionella dresdenensis]|uniref:Multidrug-efflux transporter n=1 Tax=Legionella dresdenensis TaxID=450200 RepID=A0ABV8CFA3_9GAMM